MYMQNTDVHANLQDRLSYKQHVITSFRLRHLILTEKKNTESYLGLDDSQSRTEIGDVEQNIRSELQPNLSFVPVVVPASRNHQLSQQLHAACPLRVELATDLLCTRRIDDIQEVECVPHERSVLKDFVLRVPDNENASLAK